MLVKQGMKMIALCGLLGAAILVSGCSPEARAKGAAQTFNPTVYGGIDLINFGVGRIGGVEESRVDETTYKVLSRTNPVTSSRQAFELALVHAAKVGEANGFTQFKVQKDWRQIRCSREGGAPMVDLRIVYGRADDELSGDNVHQVDSVLAELWDKVNAKGVSQSGDSKTYLENLGKCRTGVRAR